jgi:hypothetical protein
LLPKSECAIGDRKTYERQVEQTNEQSLRGKAGKFREFFEGQINFKRGKYISAKKCSQLPKEYLGDHPPGIRSRRDEPNQ